MNTYTDTQRTEAVAAYLQHGAAEAARQTGIPKRTISEWAKRDGATQTRATNADVARQHLAKAIAEKREKLRLELISKALAGAEAADPTDPAGYQRLSVGVGTFLDKFRLEMGEATGRTESIDLSAAESRIDQEIERLLALHEQS